MAHWVKCKFCGTVGRSKRARRGSGKVEIYLWTLLLLPGPFYSIWRLMGSYDACKQCGSSNLEVMDDIPPPDHSF